MRGGYFLAEDSPQNLLNHYGFDSLEDVFLQLSILQNTKTKPHLTKAANNAIFLSDTMIDSSINSRGAINEALVMEEVDSDNINVNKFPRSPSITSYLSDTEPGSKKYYSVINTDHLRALLWKNFSWMLRNIPIMICVLVMPFMQGLIFCLSIGHEPINLSIAVVNYETIDARNCQDNITCDSVHLGCSYLKYLENRDFILVILKQILYRQSK